MKPGDSSELKIGVFDFIIECKGQYCYYIYVMCGSWESGSIDLVLIGGTAYMQDAHSLATEFAGMNAIIPLWKNPLRTSNDTKRKSKSFAFTDADAFHAHGMGVIL